MQGADLAGQPSEAARGLSPRYLVTRRRESNDRLQLIIEALSGIGRTYDPSRVCIYATGSYGRSEAAATADLDLFMVDTGVGGGSLDKGAQALLKAEIIARCRELELPGGGHLPEFTRNGYFLVVHRLEEIDKAMGGQRDDATNHFTAKLLLLLESRCLYNRDAYERALTRVLTTYFRDVPPTVLLDDIARYWETLCRHHGYARVVALKGQLKNLKLRFNRAMTCFSALVCLAQHDRVDRVSPVILHEMISMSPTERLEWLAQESPAVRVQVRTVLREYSWWLERTEGGEELTLQWLRNRRSLQDANEAAQRYGEAFQALLEAGSQGGSRRYVAM